MLQGSRGEFPKLVPYLLPVACRDHAPLQESTDNSIAPYAHTWHNFGSRNKCYDA